MIGREILTAKQVFKYETLEDWCDCNRDICHECPFYTDTEEEDTSKFHWCHCDAFNNETQLKVFLNALDKDFEYYLENLKESDEANEVIHDKETSSESNAVDHPSHYNQGGIECIDALLAAFGREAVAYFCICNAMKYLWRTEHKNGVEDCEKAKWYIDKYMELR